MCWCTAEDLIQGKAVLAISELAMTWIETGEEKFIGGDSIAPDHLSFRKLAVTYRRSSFSISSRTKSKTPTPTTRRPSISATCLLLTS